MPSIERLRTRHAGRPFEVLCVNYGESPERVRQFLEREMVDLPVLMDRDKEAAPRWKAKGFPMTFLVDARGRIRYWTYGEREWDKGEGAARVDELLAEAKGARR
jgi:peroxiredoxin